MSCRITSLPFCALFIAIAASFSPVAQGEAVNVNGRVTQVTLFRGQAQVTRVIPVEGAAGSIEIVVGDLPEQVVADSLFAEGGDTTAIRAVRFRTRAIQCGVYSKVIFASAFTQDLSNDTSPSIVLIE